MVKPFLDRGHRASGDIRRTEQGEMVGLKPRP